MDFLITRGFRDSRLNFTAADTVEACASGGSLYRRSVGPFEVFSTTHCIQSEAGTLYIFDGNLSIGGEFFHPFLLEGREADLARAVEKALRSPSAVNGGVYCAGVVAEDTVVATRDPISQYPLYTAELPEGWMLSNCVPLLVSALSQAGVRISRSLAPCIDNMVIGGVLGQKTHIDQIKTVPFGHRVVCRERLEFQRVYSQDAEGQSYDEIISRAHAAIASHVKSCAQAAGENAPNVLADITGGSDSRCVLSFLLNSGFAGRIGGRSITKYPNPDANSAQNIMHAYGISAGKVPMVQTVSPRLVDELAVRMNAAVWGGGRDSGAPTPPIAIRDHIQFKGMFGELGGATPGLDYVAESIRRGGYTKEAAIDIWIERRRSVRGLDLLTADAVEQVRASLIKAFGELEAEGYGHEHLQAEIYLRSRSRTHFGWTSAIDNKTRVIPDILASQWVVEARRALPAALHVKNKVIFDLTQKNDIFLTFMPLADKRWDVSIVPENMKRLCKAMPMVTRSSPKLVEEDMPLINPLHIPNRTYADYVALTQGAAPVERKRFALEASIQPFQEMLKFALETFGPSDAVWDCFDRHKVDEYALRQPEEFSESSVDTSAMGRVAAGVLWMLDLGIVPHVHSVRPIGDFGGKP